MKLIVGLGNPGIEYDLTRHNVGFMAIDCIAEHYKISIDKSKFNGLYGMGQIEGEKVILLKPQSYMNLSGEVIAKYVNYYKISIDDVLIICDDLDTAIGKYRIRYQGGCGGHNGLKNIELHLHTKEYKRIRIGISENNLADKKDYVLGRFSSEEENVLKELLVNMPKIISDFVNLTFDNLMNKYNK